MKLKCVILATVTYLRGKVVYGEVNYESGPNGLCYDKPSASLQEHGVELISVLRSVLRHVLMHAALITVRWNRNMVMQFYQLFFL